MTRLLLLLSELVLISWMCFDHDLKLFLADMRILLISWGGSRTSPISITTSTLEPYDLEDRVWMSRRPMKGHDSWTHDSWTQMSFVPQWIAYATDLNSICINHECDVWGAHQGRSPDEHTTMSMISEHDPYDTTILIQWSHVRPRSGWPIVMRSITTSLYR